MCLLLIANRVHPEYKLILAANRDEFYDRPAAAASFWKDHPEILAGRDIKAGGTWLGVTKHGKIAAITNYRQGLLQNENAPSRGDILKDFLTSDLKAKEFYKKLSETAHLYNKFNLVFGSVDELYFFSNVEGALRPLNKGLFGLSNCSLDTPWPKVTSAKSGLDELLKDNTSDEGIFNLLGREEIFPDEKLPDTGIGLDLERILSSVFIKTPLYGTRNSTIVKVSNDNTLQFIEKTYDLGEESNTVRFSFRLEQA